MRRFKAVVIALAFLTCGVFALSCSGGDSPKAVAQRFLDECKTHSVPLECITPDTNYLALTLSEEFKPGVASAMEIADVTPMNSNWAIVTVINRATLETTYLDLVRDYGRWLIRFEEYQYPPDEGQEE